MGLKQASYEVVRSENYRFDCPIVLPWRSVYIQYTRRVDWLGDIENPLGGVLLKGSFEVVGPAAEGFLLFYGSNYGATDGPRTSVFETLMVAVGNHASEVIENVNL